MVQQQRRGYRHSRRCCQKGTGFYDLFEKPVNGIADERPLLVTPQAKAPLDWSRDGRFLLYNTQDPKTALRSS
jgi:hypothetical protein